MPTPPQGHSTNSGQNRPADRAQPIQSAPSPADGGAGPGREFHRSGSDRIGDAIFRALARTGIGPAHLLTTRGRKTGRLRTTRWSWSHRTTGSGWSPLRCCVVGTERPCRRTGHPPPPASQPDLHHPGTAPAEAGPILQRHVDIAPATRAYFHASKNSPVAEFIAEADHHPVFELTPASQG